MLNSLQDTPGAGSGVQTNLVHQPMFCWRLYTQMADLIKNGWNLDFVLQTGSISFRLLVFEYDMGYDDNMKKIHIECKYNSLKQFWFLVRDGVA